MVPFAVALLLPVLTGPPPELMPTHWGGGGVDGLATGAGYLGAVLGVTGFCALLAGLSSLLWMVVPDAVSRWLLTAVGAVGAGVTGAYLLTLVGLRAAGGDPQAVSPGWAVGSVLVAGLGALAVSGAHGRARVDRREVLESVPERDRVVPVPAGPPPEWETSVGSSLLAGTAVFVAVVFVAVTGIVVWSSGWPAGLLMALLGLGMAGYVLAWSRVRLRVDDAGLTVRSERLPVRLRRIAVDDVVGVSSTTIDPMRWGGYGLRALPGRLAYVVSGGPGIVVHRGSGLLFAVEVTEGEPVADAGAEALRRAAGQALGHGSPGEGR